LEPQDSNINTKVRSIKMEKLADMARQKYTKDSGLLTNPTVF
jgi:hypothetical protein